MKQVLIILRGAPCSGKTTLGKNLRNFEKKITWLSLDYMKPIFSEFKDETLEAANEASLNTLNYLFEQEYSVVFDGIFKNPEHLKKAIKIADNRNIPIVIYQLECSLKTLLARDKNRAWVKRGADPLGDGLITSLYEKVINNPIKEAIKLNTEEKSLEECLKIIRKNFD
jgi:predicted kinase